MDTLHRRLARRIREVAKERGIVVTHVPDRAGVTRSHFWHVMNGDSSPTLAWVAKIARVLGVEPSDLIAKTRAG